MKASAINKNRGLAKVAAGKVNEVAGKAVGSPKLQIKGQAHKVAGKIQRRVGKSQEARGR